MSVFTGSLSQFRGIGAGLAGNQEGNPGSALSLSQPKTDARPKYASQANTVATRTLTAQSEAVLTITGAGAGGVTVTLPVVSTLPIGTSYDIINGGGGTVTINSSGGNAVYSLLTHTSVRVYSVATTGTAAAVWAYSQVGACSTIA